MENSNNNGIKGQHVISDIGGALEIILGSVISVVLGLIIFWVNFFSFTALIISGLLILIGYGLYKNFQLSNRGYVVDIDNDLLFCPGKKEPANLSEMFSLSNLKNYFSETTIKISDIQSVQALNEKSFNETTKAWVYSYKLTIVGGFGVYAAVFKDMEKRDQLDTILVQVCRLGDSVVIR